MSRLCRRADGSVYGTHGHCRKGVEISAPADKEAYLRRLNSGKDERSKAEQKESDKLLHDGVKDIGKYEERHKRLTDKGLSEAEADGVLAWVSKDYPRMNRTVYSDEKDTWAEQACIRAKQGMMKLDRYDRDALVATDPKWAAIAAKGVMTPPGTTQRGIDLPWVGMEESLNKMYPVGSEITNSMFMGSAAMTTHPFLKRSSTIISIEHKTDGTTSGVTVDEFKSAKYEAEVMYPPGTRFRVKSTEIGTRVVQLNVPTSVRGRFPAAVADDPEAMLKLSKISEWQVALGKTKAVSKQESMLRKLEREKDFIESLGKDFTPQLAKEYFAIFGSGSIVKEVIQQSRVTLEEI